MTLSSLTSLGQLGPAAGRKPGALAAAGPAVQAGGQPSRLRLGTRRSALALTQSGLVADELRTRLGVEVDLVHIVTEGDRNRAEISQLGSTGVWVSALREALLAGEVDLAVHSLKDLPTAAPEGITLAAIPGREDVRDVLVSPSGRTLAELGPGARIGTGAPRRAAQLRALGLGLDVVAIRGNVDTRIRKAVDGEVDAVVLARAGLARLGRLDAITEVLEPEVMLPAPGQGALAIECATTTLAPLTLLTVGTPEDQGAVTGMSCPVAPGSGVEIPLERLLRFVLDDAPSSVAVRAERAFLAAIEAGCTAPVGALAQVADGSASGGELRLRAVVASLDGKTVLRRELEGQTADPEALGRRLADDLLSAGAHTLMGTR